MSTPNPVPQPRDRDGNLAPTTNAPPGKTPSAPPIAHIRRRKRGTELSYEALREQGIAYAQALSGDLWTDYNLHDPGVTLLEALSFALTEGVFIASQPVADLLTEADGRIHYRRHGLHPPQDILPCRPTTRTDQLRSLLDALPDVRQLRVDKAIDADGFGNGLWRIALQTNADDSAAMQQPLAAAAQVYWAQRNLCEDLAAPPMPLRVWECGLEIDLEIEGARDPADILAELIARSAHYVSARPQQRPLQDRLADANAPTLAEAFDGPLLAHGWIDAAALNRDPDQRLYFSDLARIVLTIDGVADIRMLRLNAAGHDNSSGSLPWQGDDWALQLHWPRDADALAGIRLSRRGTPIAVPAGVVLQRLENLRDRHGQQQRRGRATAVSASPLTPPSGHYVAAQPYFSAYNHLPPIYRGISDGASLAAVPSADPAQAAQFSAYLALLEQWLAHGEAQSQNLRALYTVSAAPTRSYWWQMLSSEHLPALDALYEGSTETTRDEAFGVDDDVLERRGRVLDHMLALHGEGCGQGSVRGFGWYFSAADWQQHLYRQKYQFLARIVRHTRDRGAGIDYSRRAFGRRGNTAVLQERVSLLLAFQHSHSRSLFSALRRYGVRLLREDAPPPASTRAAPPPDLQPLPLWTPARQRIEHSLKHDDRSLLRVLGAYFPALAGAPLSPAFLRCAVHAERYLVASTATDESAETTAAPLWLGPDEHGRWWPLALGRDAPATELAAMRLHQFACRLQLESEGLHLIEHILLRPIAGVPDQSADSTANSAADTDDVPAHFYPHQITAVLPRWTARGADPAFRALAEETLALSCPAHIQPQVLWLDAGALLALEHQYQAWLDAKRAHCTAVTQAKLDNTVVSSAASQLDNCAQTLRRTLWAHSRASRPGSEPQP